MNVKFECKSVSEMLRSRGLEERQQVQRYIDNAVLRYSDPYIPFDTGTLKKSGTVHTVIGSGKVKYKTPYARSAYYSNAGRGNEGMQRGGIRGKLWFERMKADKLPVILQGVKNLLRSMNP